MLPITIKSNPFDALRISSEGIVAILSDRIRIQKLVYLLKQYDRELAFGYSWYIHGPYSPELTRMLFADQEAPASEIRLTHEEMTYVNAIHNFLKEDFYSPDALELIVSLIYLRKNGRAMGLHDEKSIVSFLLKEKPQFSEEEVKATWAKILSVPKWKKLLDGRGSSA